MPAQQASASDPHPPHPQQDTSVSLLPSKSEGETKQLHKLDSPSQNTGSSSEERYAASLARHATRLLLMQQMCHGLQSLAPGGLSKSLKQAGMHTITYTPCMHAYIHTLTDTHALVDITGQQMLLLTALQLAAATLQHTNVNTTPTTHAQPHSYCYVSR